MDGCVVYYVVCLESTRTDTDGVMSCRIRVSLQGTSIICKVVHVYGVVLCLPEWKREACLTFCAMRPLEPFLACLPCLQSRSVINTDIQ